MMPSKPTEILRRESDQRQLPRKVLLPHWRFVKTHFSSPSRKRNQDAECVDLSVFLRVLKSHHRKHLLNQATTNTQAPSMMLLLPSINLTWNWQRKMSYRYLLTTILLQKYLPPENICFGKPFILFILSGKFIFRKFLFKHFVAF